MKKIINLNDPALNKAGPRKKKNQTERLDEFAMSLKTGSDIVTEIATSSKVFGKKLQKNVDWILNCLNWMRIAVMTLSVLSSIILYVL